jgi:GR25 family glycosyltransferase involved in LPS biosynthesis
MNISIGNGINRKIEFFFKRLLRKLGAKKEIKIFGSSENEIAATYIVNLDRQIDRWAKFKKEAQFQKVKGNKNLLDFCYRISAIDGKELNLKEFTSHQILNSYNLSDQYYVDPDPRLLSIIRKRSISVDLTREEIAVALSHIKAWQRIVDENKPYALILEDDVFFEREFADRLNQIWQELPVKRDDGSKFDLLYLSFREVDQGAEKAYFSKNMFRPKRGLWWLSGYVLSFSGAKKLLEELPICGPVDLWINHKFSKLDVFASLKSIIYQRVDLKSDNNYSILPILSQIGIQSNKTHLILEKKKGKNPVFIIDLGEMGSEVIGNALYMLGYRCCINKWNEFSARIDKIIDNNEPLLFDAYAGFNSINSHYKKLDLLYPNAVFIIIDSPFKDKFNGRNDNTSRKINIQHQIPKLRDTDEVFEYFSKRREKLLTINIYVSNCWEQLCKFLKCEIPKFSFPNIENCLRSTSKLNISKSVLTPIDYRRIKLLEHDVHPWIIPMENLQSYGVNSDDRQNARLIGSYEQILDDNFNWIDNSIWRILENTFPSNLAQFTKRNLSIIEDKGFKMTLMKEKSNQKEYTSASIVTRKSHHYGRFEVQMKPLKANGIITAFFLHRNDPWQEIDFEFLGNDTTKILINVYYNPGVEGSNYNYGNRGTPITIDLNFDASQAYHVYAIEWEPHEIRWYVDKALLYVRATWEPTPIPDHPMQFFINTWPSGSEELVGSIENDILPQSSFVSCVKIYSWSSNALKTLSNL